MKKKIIIILLIIVSLIIVAFTVFNFYKKTYKFNINNIIINNNNRLDENNLYTINIKYDSKYDTKCSIDNKEFKDIKDCTYKLSEGKYTIYLKNKYYNTKKEFEINKNYEGTFSSTLDNLDEYYLALNGNKKLDFKFDYSNTFDKNIRYSIDDPSIISFDNNIIKGLKVGTTYLNIKLVDGNSKKYKITVTDLIQPATYNNNKQYLPCKRYSEEEATLLDKILESRVKEAGVVTRAGVAAAARFLTLEFPYMIRYFNENGRLNDHGARPHIDGEGRFYHKGLYLSESKYKILEPGAHTATGPKIWGCNIYDAFISKMNMNGFTCSGFVTWAMLNGGFDVGDSGAGDYKQFNDDLSDLGPHHEITEEYMKNGNYKVGDFIARDGHAALIIGIDDNNIYTAESLPSKLKAYTYERYHSIVKDTNLTYIIEMGNIYPNGDGNITNMW